jgi:hypothetical protein
MPVVAERSGRGFRPYKKAAGLPDIFAMHADPPRLLILELKGDGGSLSDAQREFLELARDVAEWSRDHTTYDDLPNMAVHVVTPGNLDALKGILQSRVLG